MIEFHIIIKQLKPGVVSFRCETPPGRATREEIEVANAFKEEFKKFTCRNGRTIITHDWGKANSPKRN